MTRTGYVKNGTIVADGPLDLVDGTVVEIKPIAMPGQHHPDTLRYAGVISGELSITDYRNHLDAKHR